MGRKGSSRIKTEKVFWIFWKGSLLTSFSLSLPLMSDQFRVCVGDSSHSSATTYKKRCFVFIDTHGFPSFESLHSSDISLHLLILRAERQEQMKKRKPVWCLPRFNPVEQGPPSSHAQSRFVSWPQAPQLLPMLFLEPDPELATYFSPRRLLRSQMLLKQKGPLLPNSSAVCLITSFEDLYLFAICRKAGYSVFSL